MRTSCTIYGPGSLVHSVAAALEKAGFDATTLQRDGDNHADGHQCRGTPMVTMVVLDRDGAETTESRSVTEGHTTTTATIRVKGRRGRPRKTAPIQQDRQVAGPDGPAAAPDDMPF